MIKLLLTLAMILTFGTSTVNAEENTSNIKDRISELAEGNPDNQSAIKARIEELSEDELEAIIANVDELTEQTEEDLVIKEAATNKLEEMKSEHVPKQDYSRFFMLLVIGGVFSIFFRKMYHMIFFRKMFHMIEERTNPKK